MSDIVGLIVSKHFHERFAERISDVRMKARILFYINANICEMLYDIALTHDNRKCFVIHGYTVVAMIDYNLEYPRLLLKTCYSTRD